MTGPVRLGAVSYLNVRPLVYGLEQRPDAVTLRFDVPSECARLLASGEIDLGMIPSIAWLDRPGDRIVPGVCIGSDGPVGVGCALYEEADRRGDEHRARHVLQDIRRARSNSLRASISESRQCSCPHSPDLAAMLASADAALIIGDMALFADHRAHTAEKIDLGAVWSEMTGLPFVWAFWSGRPDASEGGHRGVASGRRGGRHDALGRDCRRVLRARSRACADGSALSSGEPGVPADGAGPRRTAHVLQRGRRVSVSLQRAAGARVLR